MKYRKVAEMLLQQALDTVRQLLVKYPQYTPALDLTGALGSAALHFGFMDQALDQFADAVRSEQQNPTPTPSVPTVA